MVKIAAFGLLLLCLSTASLASPRASMTSPRASRASSNESRSDLEHSLQLDDNYQVLWTLGDAGDVTFEVRVATLGYVVFGLSADGQFRDADVVVGWIQNGRARFQVRRNSNFFIIIMIDFYLIGN